MILIQHATVVGATAVAAYTDVRVGKIPNWLTYPLLLAGPAVFYLGMGTEGLSRALTGMLACGFVPFFMWRAGGMSGGDVKLFAGIGAMTGALVGIEVLFYSVCAAMFVALGMLIKNKRLLVALGNIFYLAFNRVLPKKWRRSVRAELKDEIRIGVPIFVGTAFAIALRHPEWVG